MNVLQEFSEGVALKAQRHGWIEIIVPIVLPLVAELINRCLNDRDKLQAYVQGRRGIGQQVMLRLRCRSAVSEAGIRGGRQVGRATTALFDAIQEQIREDSGSMSGDIYQQAVEEAAGLES